MGRLILEPSIQKFSQLCLKLFFLYCMAYFFGFLMHIPVCFALVSTFTHKAFLVAKISQELGIEPFYTDAELASYGFGSQIIASSFIAFLLATALFFIACPLCLLVFGFFKSIKIALVVMLSTLWFYLGSSPGMPIMVNVLMVLPPVSFCLVLFFGYRFLETKDEIDLNLNSPSEELHNG